MDKPLKVLSEKDRPDPTYIFLRTGAISSVHWRKLGYWSFVHKKVKTKGSDQDTPDMVGVGVGERKQRKKTPWPVSRFILSPPPATGPTHMHGRG